MGPALEDGAGASPVEALENHAEQVQAEAVQSRPARASAPLHQLPIEPPRQVRVECLSAPAPLWVLDENATSTANRTQNASFVNCCEGILRDLVLSKRTGAAKGAPC